MVTQNGRGRFQKTSGLEADWNASGGRENGTPDSVVTGFAKKKPPDKSPGAWSFVVLFIRIESASVAEEEDSGGFLVGHGLVGDDGAVEELVGVEIDLEEGRALGDLFLDQGFRQRVLNIAL